MGKMIQLLGTAKNEQESGKSLPNFVGICGFTEFLFIVSRIGSMNSRAKDDCNKEACHSSEKNLCPVDAVVQEVI